VDEEETRDPLESDSEEFAQVADSDANAENIEFELNEDADDENSTYGDTTVSAQSHLYPTTRGSYLSSAHPTLTATCGFINFEVD
jgi:hypothetical protein